MIQKMSHVTLFVNNQDEAKDFYVNKLGFEVRTDHTMDGGFRWLTVGPKTQPDLEIVLMEPKAGPMFDEEAAQAIRMLLKKGVLGSGVFQVDDCQQDLRRSEKEGRPVRRRAGGSLLRRRSDHEGRRRQLVQHDAAEELAVAGVSNRCSESR